VLRSNEDVEMKDVEDEEEDEDEVVSELDPNEGLFFGAYPPFDFDEQKQSQVRKNSRMKMHLNPFLAIVIHNSPWVTKATVHTSFAETTLECLIMPLTIQSNIMRR
jgi:hypothetical protein